MCTQPNTPVSSFGRLGGFQYRDLINIYGVSRAGYVPQLISSQLPNAAVVFELLSKASSRALVYDRSLIGDIHDAPLPVFASADITSLSSYQSVQLPPLRLPKSANELSFIFHTSGSTSGSPKLVPCSYTYVAGMIAKAAFSCRPKHSNRQDVSTWM